MAKKENRKIIIGIFIVILIVGGLFATKTLNFASGCQLPVGVYSGIYFNPNNPNSGGLNVPSCYVINPGVTAYSINYESGFVTPLGTTEAYSTVYIASSSATASQANTQNQGSLASSKANQTSDSAKGGQLYTAEATDEGQLQSVINAAINSNNGGTTTSTTTICSGLNCGTTSTTTIPQQQWCVLNCINPFGVIINPFVWLLNLFGFNLQYIM